MKTAWGQQTAYRLNFFLQVIGPTLIFFFVKYNLWTSVYQGKPDIVIGSFTLPQMLSYHAWAMAVGLVASGHAAMNLSEDIRLGRISSYLIYPFNFWEFHTASFFAFQGLQIIIASITVIAAHLFGILPLPGIDILAIALIYTLFVSLFWFSLQFLTGILAFWLEETWILRVTLTILSSFLSGAIIPLDIFPEWLHKTLLYTPFPYLAYVPIRLLQGADIDLGNAFATVGAWMIAVCFINSLIWKRGMRLYTAAGM
jgi:ABC-2 type transport system permease protein